MLGLTPTAGAPIADFHNDLLFTEAVGLGGAVVGGTGAVIRIVSVLPNIGGAVAGGSSPDTRGAIGTGYPIYGDFCYGDMPYLERQQEMEGGMVAGGAADFLRVRVDSSDGGAIVGGVANYIRIWCQVSNGGSLGGGWSDEDGDFSKVISVEFVLKWPEALFVPPSERWDINNVLRSIE